MTRARVWLRWFFSLKRIEDGEWEIDAVIWVLIPVALAWLLVGCATPVRTAWEKPGHTRAGFALDKYECVQQSRTSWSGGGSGVIGLAIMASAQNRAQQEAERLFALCLESRGYTGRVLQDGEPAPVRP